MRRVFFATLLLAGCNEPVKPFTVATRSGDTTPAELQARPAGKHTYDVRVLQRVDLRRRGAGPGNAMADLRATLRIVREDGPAEGEGAVTVRLKFDRADASPRGVLSATAAASVRALAGARATYVLGPRGHVARFSFEGPAAAKPFAELVGGTFLRLAPTFGDGPKGMGARWGETANVPFGIAGSEPMTAQVNANYVVQGMGKAGNAPCLVVDVDLRTAGGAASPGTPAGTTNVSGSGRGQLCVDTENGALRAGGVDFTLKGNVGLRGGKVSPLLHIEQTLRLRIEANEVAG